MSFLPQRQPPTGLVMGSGGGDNGNVWAAAMPPGEVVVPGSGDGSHLAVLTDIVVPASGPLGLLVHAAVGGTLAVDNELTADVSARIVYNQYDSAGSQVGPTLTLVNGRNRSGDADGSGVLSTSGYHAIPLLGVYTPSDPSVAWVEFLLTCGCLVTNGSPANAVFVLDPQADITGIGGAAIAIQPLSAIPTPPVPIPPVI